MIASRRIALRLSQSFISLARYRTAARIVAVSNFVAKSVIASGLPRDSVEVIYDGVEIPPEISRTDRENAREHFAIPHESPCIGNVGAFVPEKGHEILLRALADLRATPGGKFPKCILLLCGEGRERERLEELARQLNVLDAVKFAGPVSEIESAFPAMDLFAFPSHEEPLGSVLLAAMAHSLPVVAIGRGGVPEVVDSGKNGLIVDSLDPQAFARGLERLLANPQEAQRLGEAGRETVQKRFSARHMADATLDLYERVIGVQSGIADVAQL